MPKSLISIKDFTKDEILHILDVAREFEQDREQNFLAGKVIACLFFEPSTRTSLSFEAAVNRLGARVIGFPDAKNTSVSKGETLEDTIKIVSNYVDMIGFSEDDPEDFDPIFKIKFNGKNAFGFDGLCENDAPMRLLTQEVKKGVLAVMCFAGKDDDSLEQIQSLVEKTLRIRSTEE